MNKKVNNMALSAKTVPDPCSKLTTYPTFFLTKLAGIDNKLILIISLLKKFFGDLGTFFSFKPFSEVGFVK